MYCTDDKIGWLIGDGGTLIFNGLLFADDGFGNYIQCDMRICLYVLYNWLM